MSTQRLDDVKKQLKPGQFAVLKDGWYVLAMDEDGVHLALDFFGIADHEEFEQLVSYSPAELIGKLFWFNEEDDTLSMISDADAEFNSVAIVTNVCI